MDRAYNKIFIAIAGNIASGKSTIAKLITSKLNFRFIPSKRPEFTFLKKFLKNQKDWFLPTQLSFIINKASELDESIFKEDNIIMDRSLYEDIDIYAKMWIENYFIDDEISDLYYRIAKHILNNTIKPDIIIYCDITPATAKKRLGERKSRDFEKFYPNDYLIQLNTYYQKWIKNFSDIPIIKLNSEQIDYRDISFQENFIHDIFNFLTNTSSVIDQNELFPELWKPEEYKLLDELRNIHLSKKITKTSLKISKHKKQIYIAAPFTQYAINKEEAPDLFVTAEYGTLSEKYKNFLLEIEKIFSKFNLKTLIPHRDINEWGEKKPDNEYLIKEIRNQINESNYLFAIPSVSVGVHFEIGIALGEKKKILILNIANQSQSFFSDIFSHLSNVYTINCKDENDAISKLKSKEINNKILNFLFTE